MYRAEMYSSHEIITTERKYLNILDIFGWVGGISKILISLGALLTMNIIDIKLNESMINEFYSVIDPINNEKVELDFKAFIYKMAKIYGITNEKDADPEGLQVNSAVFNKFFDFDTVKSLYNHLELQKQNESADGLFKNQGHVVHDMDDRKKARFEIIYEIFKYRAYDKIFFSGCEIFQLVFIPSVCHSKDLKKKHKVFNDACKKLKEETDFPELLKSVREFQRILRIFFEEGQLDMFNSMVNKTITIDKINRKKNKEKEKEKLKKEKKSTIISSRSSNLNNLDMTENIQELGEEEKKDFENLKKLNIALEKLMDEDRLDRNLDRNLLKNVNVNEKLINEFFPTSNKKLEENSTKVSENLENKNHIGQEPPELHEDLTTLFAKNK
jgi:hypothetical protein